MFYNFRDKIDFAHNIIKYSIALELMYEIFNAFQITYFHL